MRIGLFITLSCYALSCQAVSFPVCYDYECGIQTTVTLSLEQWQFISAPLDTLPVSSHTERQALRTTIARFEQVVGAITGTSADLAENAQGAGDPGQMDCIDESTNSETYLTLLQSRQRLRFHTVKPRVYRNKWIFDVHWAAIIEETATGDQFAVDSWFLDNGKPPYIQALKAWKNKDSFVN